MMNFSTYAIIGILAALLPGCNGCNKTTEELSGHYAFFDYGLGKRRIYPGNAHNPIHLYGDIIDHAYNDSFIVALQSPSLENHRAFLGFDLYLRFTYYADNLQKNNIDSSITKPSYKVADSINYMIFKSRGATVKNSMEDRDIQDAVADSLLKHDPFYTELFHHDNFWIISVARDSLYGPYSKEKYLEMKKQLHIPDDVKLDVEK